MKTKTLQARIARLMPAGVPRYVRCYDNGGESADRYTVCFTGRAGCVRAPGYAPEYCYRAMSADPFAPQGFGMWGSTKGQHCDTNRAGWAPPIGRSCRLGKRIRFEDLPEDCRRLVLRDYREIWRLNPAPARPVVIDGIETRPHVAHSDSEIAEWVGSAYRLHWESLSEERKQEFRERYNG